MAALKSEGVFFPNFCNDGETFTVAGHAALTTRVYQSLNNHGEDLP